MPSIPHMSEEQFHEFHLDGKQMVFLFMASTVVAVVIFLCGVMVGRGVRENQVGTPLQTSASGSDPTGSDVAPPPPAADLLTTPPEELAEAVAEDITYPKWLESTSAKPEALRNPEPRRETPAPPAPEPPQPAAEPARSAPAAEPAAATDTRRSGRLVVQVMSVTERAQAEAAARSLASKGYPSFVAPTTAGRPHFRVRVGPYATHKEAAEVAARLEKQEKFRDPWIAPASS